MIEPAVQWIRSLNDPLRNPKLASRWIAQLQPADPMGIQKEALELVGSFPGARREAGPNQVDALLRIDARLELVIAHFTQQYCDNYQKSSSVESRLWHTVFDLVKAFIAAYQNALKTGFPRAEQKRWRAILPWVVVRLAHYKGLDAKYRLFRYSHWIPAQWREYHELAEFARMRGWQREQLVLGASGFTKSSVSFEQEYIKTLMLMRLDSGNFTPDQVEWVTRQLEDWAPSLSLHSNASEGAGFVVDFSGMQGLRRRNKAQSGGRLQFLDTGPAYTRVIEQMRWLPDHDDEAVQKPGDLPPREQKLLLMRLAALFGPDALAQAPRAERYRSEGDVRVVVGLQALTRAIAEIERLPDQARTPGIAASYDEVTQMVAPQLNPESVARRVRGAMWKIVDRSDSGCRLVAPVRDAPAKLGELIGIRDGDEWMLAVVRRMQRQQVDEVTVGAEVIARRLVRVLMRSWVPPTVSAGVTISGDRPFFGIYLPAHADNRRATQRSLIGPEDKLTHGGMVELDTGNARYLIRFSEIIERQGGWAWGLFNAVRKLGV